MRYFILLFFLLFSYFWKFLFVTAFDTNTALDFIPVIAFDSGAAFYSIYICATFFDTPSLTLFSFLWLHLTFKLPLTFFHDCVYRQICIWFFSGFLWLAFNVNEFDSWTDFDALSFIVTTYNIEHTSEFCSCLWRRSCFWRFFFVNRFLRANCLQCFSFSHCL